ncbi:MAG: threonylcarbamoyl-AMP synthase [Candidatus Thermoplasmatota archaeon]|nr:threonylcarbamoyl-AMP synthase [Candidatus Thermoplasmatota archaeon]
MKKNDVSNAIKALKTGNLIVYPTDTLYALGADIFNDGSVTKVFTVKKRPFSNPLSVAVADFEAISKIAYTNEFVKQVVERFLPGSLTIILRKKESVSRLVTGGLDNIAVRIPDNKIALKLLSAFGPLTVTSANVHGKKTPYVIKDIMMQFTTDILVYLDDGRLDAKPSTIVDLTLEKPRIVRKGSITLDEILDAI